MNPGLVIAISGRGSNALAIIEACAGGTLGASVRAVIADRPAAGIAAAGEHGIDTVLVPRAKFDDRAAFETALAEVIEGFDPALVALAGFMRVLSAGFVERFAGRMVNIHPSLLPRHRGLDTHARALAAGDAEHGASVHWVTPELDAGPVIAQARVPVASGDTVETLAARVLDQEHRLYPATLALLFSGAVGSRHEPDEPLLLDRDFDAAGRLLGGGR